MEKGFFIDTVILEELCVVAKISEERVKLPKRSLGAIQATSKGARFEGLRLQNEELQFNKSPLRMPPVARSLHANKK